jgi:hypothetical protein
MTLAKNVSKAEGIVRVVCGISLIVFGFSLTGLWMTLSLGLGVFLMFTTFFGH